MKSLIFLREKGLKFIIKYKGRIRFKVNKFKNKKYTLPLQGKEKSLLHRNQNSFSLNKINLDNVFRIYSLSKS